ncbi:diguanylate cyclase (GGDEF)-like protein [Azospirillum fermentarium]|uniref:GGDEF domain-containing protein n=1 Tax=Azospirillum fermentarium TaxID=1233114 RepID=UPI002226DD2B|nr:response regulator [Azospirillum fermentarium]MCW2246140.1 diguanylate cyclase (GGDEF)-like protein [Azospirillum fermentarium]
MPSGTPVSYEQDFAELTQLYRDTLLTKAGRIADLWQRVQTGTPNTREAVADLLLLTHTLAGSAETFGYGEVSRLAGSAERLLRTCVMAETAAMPAMTTQALTTLFSDLQRAAGGERETATAEPCRPASPAIDAGGRGRDSVIFLIDADDGMCRWLGERVEPFGYHLHSFASVESALAAPLRPDVVLLDLALHDSGRWADAAHCFGARASVVFMTPRADFQARLAAVRAGCAGYLVKPVDALDLVYVLDDLTGRQDADPYRILIVDDDEALPDAFALALREAGMEAAVLREPARILDTMAEVMPDLVLLDMYMPGCNGMELAQVLRQHRRFLGTPIVFLSREGDRDLQLAAMRPGVDDFLTKPIRSDHLAEAVLLRAERGRTLRAAMQTDSLTGLLNHAHFKERLATEIARSRRNGTSLAVALLDIDHFKRVNDTYGHMAGDRVIRTLSRLLSHRLRRSDIIGRYGGEEFAVALPDTNEHDAHRVIDTLRDAFAKLEFNTAGLTFSMTFSAGIAGDDGESGVSALLSYADSALYAAKRIGRNRVTRASSLDPGM